MPAGLAVSPDGGALLVAFNLANAAAIVDTRTGAVRYVAVGGYPVGAAITADGLTGLCRTRLTAPFPQSICAAPIWKQSLILVVESNSLSGHDHVDAHRIPALVISPYAKAGAVVHTRYDLPSFMRTIEIVLGLRPMNLFDANAVPLYDAFSSQPDNIEAYNAIQPTVDMLARQP